MLFRVNLPPKFFTEVFCLAANTLEIIEVAGRDAFKFGTETSHGERREAVVRARIIQVAEEETHQFAALGFALFPSRRFGCLFLNVGKDFADGFHLIRMRFNGSSEMLKPHDNIFITAIDAVDVAER